MNFRLTSEQAAFQREVTDFIEQGLPPGWDTEHESFEEGLAIERDVMTRLAAKRWLALPWPKEYGGLGASPMQQLIFNEQMAYHGVPGTVNMGVAWVGPVVMLYGREDQKAQYLSRIADGTDLWCTLYSEPSAGSDLAAMQTRAVRDGDDYVINGQKIWTSFGHYADWGWLAVRTDPDVPKHKGISTFAIKMDTPGITIRPLVNMAGTHEFNEVFFEDVRVPATNLVGEENRGWYNVAVGLDFERSSIGATSNSRRMVDDLVTYLRETKPGIDNAVKQRQFLARLRRNARPVHFARGIVVTSDPHAAHHSCSARRDRRWHRGCACRRRGRDAAAGRHLD